MALKKGEAAARAFERLDVPSLLETAESKAVYAAGRASQLGAIKAQLLSNDRISATASKVFGCTRGVAKVNTTFMPRRMKAPKLFDQVIKLYDFTLENEVNMLNELIEVKKLEGKTYVMYPTEAVLGRRGTQLLAAVEEACRIANEGDFAVWPIFSDEDIMDHVKMDRKIYQGKVEKYTMQDGIFNAYVMDYSRYNAIITERLYAYVCLSQGWEPDNYTVEISNMEPINLWTIIMKASEPPEDVATAVANQILRSQEFPAVGDWEKYAIRLKMAISQQTGDNKAVINNLVMRMTQSKDTVYRAVGQAVMANGDVMNSVDALSALVIEKRHSQEMQTNLEAGTLVARLGGLEVSRTNFTT